MACLSTIPVKRPSMSDVVNELKECLAAELARKRDGCGSDIENKDSTHSMTLNLTIEHGPLAS